MPAESEAQRRAASMALAAKRGHLTKRELKGAALSMYESMSMAQLEDFVKKPKK
jgi:hypothetical protein